ncbi:MAG: EAL domain-containing protein [Acidimicrobiales bacterium]|nr:EAL domain-containing protein [Acidimicrobiales bacterium]
MSDPDLVIECDDAGVIRSVVGDLRTHLGYVADEVVGQPIADYLHPRNQAVAGPIVTTLAGQPQLELWDEVRVRNPDGSWTWVMASVRGGGPGQLPLVVSVRSLPDEATEELNARHDLLDAWIDREERFRVLAEATPVGVFQHSMTDGCVYVNERWTQITGLARDAAMGRGWQAIIHPDDTGAALADYEARGAPLEGPRGNTFRIVRPDGQLRWVKVATSPVLGPEGELHSVVGTLDDITDAIDAVAGVSRLTQVLEATPDLVGVYEVADDAIYLNDAARRFFGFGPRDDGRVPLADLHARLPSWMTEGWDQAIGDALLAASTWSGELELTDAQGVDVPMLAQLMVRRDELDRVVGFAAILRDISDRKVMEAQLEHQATHDPLTGLPNRTLLLQRLGLALERAREGGRPVAVLFLDLDRFKVVNDSLGHQQGDHVLVTLAERIRRAVDPTQTVARFGGDEFVVLAENVGGPEEPLALAGELIDQVHRPLDASTERFVLSTSIGIAISDPEATPETLLRDADAAMYRAKGAGRSQALVFDPAMRADAMVRFDVEAALRRAVAGEELRLHFQPKVDLRSGTIIGVEALVRWQHPSRGLLLPDQFLDVATETGLITEIGSWVIDRGMADLARFDEVRGPDAAPLYLCLNLSATELAHPDLVPTIASALERHGVDPGHIDLELTEHSLVADVDASARRLGELRAMGLKIAIDDFGTGYSSLAYLRRLPVDLLKIDRTFVEGLGERAEDAAIVHAIASLASSLGLAVVAEGVETPEQLAALREIGVTMAQGHLIARPQPADDVIALLRQGPSW